MIKLKKSFKHEYERKLFIIGLSEMLKCANLPESLKPILVELLSNIVEMMIVFNKKIEKDLLTKAQGELKDNEDDSDNSDSDEEDDSSNYDDIDNDDEENFESTSMAEDDLGFVSSKP